MEEEAEDLGSYLKEKFGEAIKFSYVDVQSEEMKNYPGIAPILDRVNFPLTVLNGEPRFHGGLGQFMIEKAVGELLAEN